MKGLRVTMGVLGGLLIGYGAIRLVHGLSGALLMVLVGWLVAVLIIHYGVLSPVVLAIGATLHRLLPERGREFVQAGLIIMAAVTIIAIPLMLRQFSQPPSKAMLLQHYGRNLLVLMVIIAIGTGVAYAIRVVRDRPRP